MGLWDWFRKKEIEEVKVEKLSPEEIDGWFSKEKADIENKEREFLKLVQERVNKLVKELEEEISALKNVKVEEIRAEEKIKLVVKENLNNYTGYLEKLTGRLKEIKEEKEIIEKINSVFEDFKKKSAMSYEKATFLVGKEIENVKESIRNFFREIEKTLKENQELIDKSKIFSSVEMKMERANEIKKLKEETERAIKECDDDSTNLKERVKNNEKEIEEIKNSRKFIEEEKKRRELEEKMQESDIEISKLREIIDFKALAKFYHSFEKEMNIIKEHKENFREQFSKTNGQEVLDLISESKMQDVGILNKIEKIRELKKDIDEVAIEHFGIEEIENEIKKINSEIAIANNKKFAEEKKCEKLEKSLEDINNSLKGELLKINVKVE